MVMSGCSIYSDNGLKEWIIDPKSIQEMYPLFNKEYEVAGRYILDSNSKSTRTLSKYETQNGNFDSVQAPDGIVNFHTHPFACYHKGGDETVWGWPSAEDMRETILFTLRGSVAHLVLAIEGLYTIQVNPCIVQSYIYMEDVVSKELGNIRKNKEALKIFKELIEYICTSEYDRDEVAVYFKKHKPEFKKLKRELSEYMKSGICGDYLVSVTCNIFRGLVILCIEIYFRATHRFRLHDINAKNFMSPADFIKFANTFKLINMFSNGQKIKGCGKLSCGGVPIYEDDNKDTQKLQDYIEDYEKDTGFYMVNECGDTLSLTKSVYDLKELFPFIKDILIRSKPNCMNTYKSKDFIWKDNWFNVVLTPNIVNIDGKMIRYDSNKLNGNKRLKFVKGKNHVIQIDGIPKFYYFDLKGDCDHNHTTKEIMEHLDSGSSVNIYDKYLVIGSNKCVWTTKLLEWLDNNGLEYEYKGYDSIQKAIKEAQVTSIPAVWGISGKYMKYIGGYDDVVT